MLELHGLPPQSLLLSEILPFQTPQSTRLSVRCLEQPPIPSLSDGTRDAMQISSLNMRVVLARGCVGILLTMSKLEAETAGHRQPLHLTKLLFCKYTASQQWQRVLTKTQERSSWYNQPLGS